MADTLDQDVQALKEWLTGAWRYLGQPSLTRYERREVRNMMRQADEALRLGLQKRRTRENVGRESRHAGDSSSTPLDLRILNLEA
jgi:hypothetical protein